MIAEELAAAEEEHPEYAERSDPNRSNGLEGPRPLAGFSDSVLLTVCPYPVRASCRPLSRSRQLPLSVASLLSPPGQAAARAR